MSGLVIILNFISLQSRISILKACLRKSPISKVCIYLMFILNPVDESCLIMNCFWTVFALICTLILSNTVTPLLTYCTFCQQDVDLDYVAKVTHGFSGADLTEICQRVR